MDPANFAKHSLPKIEYNEMHPSKTYAYNDAEQYEEFQEEFLNYVTGDCHAITLNDEVLYNSYDDKSVREQLQEDMIRDKIMDRPHSLFVKLFRTDEKARVIVYLFGQNPWFVAIHYEPGSLKMEYYKSKKYMDTYETK